ncbi:Coiled-coil domain-containing protein [Paragonimus westermani]|uniref:Coiled-coil domain-containing protein n=1 Tax=Paragonimus westermani TaxID=34504 RepID=A0A8T0DR66_9TREM|nr:Coiled-coil domain-containing protein [Paragonimus westermani]
MPSTTDVVENSSGDNYFEDGDVLPNELLHAVQHKINYQTLKDAYQKLQASHIKLESELALKMKDMQIMEQKYSQMEKKAIGKIRLLEEAYEETARTQLTQERLEMIKLQVREDIEEHYREQIAQAHAGTIAARDETGRLREEVVKLATELDRERSESQTKIAQNKMLYEAEVSNLRQIKEELTARINRLTTDEIDRSHSVGKENAQLTTKCNLLSGELDELKSKMDLHREKLIQDNKCLRKSNSELKVLNQELEAERDSLRKQLQLLKSEFEAIRVELVTERQRAFDAVRASSEAENRLSCLTQKTRLELSNLRLEAQQQRSEIEAQRDQFAGKCQGRLT